jgi:type I restriction-modification system DNA methylase subunit/restriction endonuclease S subunit
MINKENLKNVLKALNFEEENNVFSKYFLNNDAYLKVDFNNNELIYPKDKGFTVNGEFTTNFSSNENFVVFECVNRLFEKGYKPEHIELEPKWQLGRGASGGRADILVKDNSGKALLIIECKTEGAEFKNEWNNMLLRGGQLMSYVQNAGSTKYICLYASDYVDDKIIPIYHVISVHDNEKLLDELKDKKPLSFAEAKALEVEDIYKAWKETYSLDFATKGIFEDDIQAYHIGKQKYSIQDLNEVGSKDIQKKYHDFATIMRQHNVSGRENAFDKLVNLFLCKIVDEAKNPKDLKFYWKGIAYDSYFDLQDRLQLLYQAGMKEFLGEDVTYIDNTAIDQAFRFFKKDPDATRETIKKYFRQLKFFTNNDFAFIDVHNEKLFYQNSVVLLKIVQMLQDTRLQSETQNQFLGDMFEGFLDQGVKQSEGQFFTPMPIVKFIINSLPLEAIITENELPPKAIDYACGAGHFLNELALQMKPFVIKNKETDIKTYYKEILGIEKEYRLSKVAKVSAFMYGQDDIKITYADALAKNTAVQDGEYSILVSNPPYSVKGFLQTLSPEDRKSYSLIKTVDEKSLANNNSIETFFLERAKQLLKPNAVASIILPSSILSNDSNIYTTTREILLKYFDIIAIVEFGSQTFGKTGTNTVTLFLRRKQENPAPAEHWKNRVEAWFGDNKAEAIYQDSHTIDKYCTHIAIDSSDYLTLLAGNPNNELLATELFLEYKKAFDNVNAIKILKKPNSAFSKKPKLEQEAELEKLFISYLQTIEKDKLYYYVLSVENKQKVIVVKCPQDNKEQKKFLGYEWSSAKGNEGIKYINQSVQKIEADDEESKELLSKLNGLHNINTPLYNPDNRNDSNKINYTIQQNYLGNEVEISEALQPYVSYNNLADMLDFSRKDFKKQISLTSKKLATIETRWELVKLGDITEIIAGQSPESQYYNEAQRGLPFYQGKKDFGKIYLNNPIIWSAKTTKESIKNDILMSVRAPVGDININPFEKICIGRGLAAIRSSNLSLQKYLFEFINQNQFLFKGNKGTTFDSISTDDLRQIKIPLPPKDIQTKIVAECEAIDNEVEIAQTEIETTNRIIEDAVKSVFADSNELKTLDKIADLSRGASPRPINEFLTEETNGIPWIKIGDVASGAKYITQTVQKITKAGAEKSRFVEKGDFIISNSMSVGRPYILAIDGCVHDGWLVLANILKSIDKDYLYYALSSETIQAQFQEKALGGVVKNLNIERAKSVKIPVPDLKIQLILVAQIEALENKIVLAQKTIYRAIDKKKAVMKKYL